MKNNGNLQGSKLGFIKEWGVRLAVTILAGLWLILIATTWSEADAADLGPDSMQSSANSTSSRSDDEYNFNWLDPDKKIYVLQNRKYLKANHAILSAMGGPCFSAQPYRTEYNFGGRVGFFFSEDWGIEGFYSAITNSANSTYDALTHSSPNALPVVREITGEYGGLLVWSPWYAKINVFNKILYFDWYFEGGPGSLQSDLDTRTNVNQAAQIVNQSFFAIYAGTGQLFHLSQDFSFRLDVLGAFYSAPVFGTTGDNSWYSNFNFSAGLSLRI